MRPALGLLFVTACATGSRADEAADANKPPADAPEAPGDADPDAPSSPADAPDPGGAGAQLLLTEVVLAPSAGEYIELANPTAQTIDLASYYLADSAAYFRLPAATPGVDSNDFIVRFPAGATIAPGGVVTVALDSAANFQLAYGSAPTYSIADGTMTAVATNSVATLTNGGELVVLFHWGGQADLVDDVDLILAGVPSAANGLVDKSAQAVDGPDADATPTAYAPDARTMAAQPTAPSSGRSTKRIALEPGNEVQAGTGNGITGDDETSENTAVTWDATFSTPTPGTLPAGLF